jgi:hypothetical protein
MRRRKPQVRYASTTIARECRMRRLHGADSNIRLASRSRNVCAFSTQRLLRGSNTWTVQVTKRILMPQMQTMIARAKVAITIVLSQWALIK